MKKLLIALMLVATTLANANAASPTPATAHDEPALLVADNFVSESEIVAVDLTARSVTLRNDDGSIGSAVVVGPEVRNLEQLKVGDKVRVQYAQALTLTLGKDRGLDSAAAAPREAHFVADISQLDTQTGAMTLQGAGGRSFDVVLKNPSVLVDYQTGDAVEGTFMQVMSIDALAPDAK